MFVMNEETMGKLFLLYYVLHLHSAPRGENNGTDTNE